METWNGSKSSGLYHIESWGAGYFGVNAEGHVEVTPNGQKGPKLDLKVLLDDLIARGIRAPVLLRFSNIVESRIKQIDDAFVKAMKTYEYEGGYRGVYPIKVNQQRFLVEEFVEFGKKSSLGLEAGSKPELLVALAHMADHDGLIICNGFKDREYIETALLSQKLGHNTIVVIDRFKELGEIVSASRSLGMRPRIGFRAKLESRGTGKWAESSGAKSKFGLTTTEIVEGVRLLEAEGMLDCLELLHFHIGSQISALRSIKDSLTEAGRLYVELAAMGANLRYLDVGGGLAVDYDGSQTNWENSRNYSLQEYANDVVWIIHETCTARNIKVPTIVTECGRALAAYSSVLLFNVVDRNVIEYLDVPTEEECKGHEHLQNMHHLLMTLAPKTLNEHVQDAYKLKDDAASLFNLGYLDLEQRSIFERLFRSFCTKVMQISTRTGKRTEDIESIEKFLTDAYFCNFSVFQSAPDTWAVDQLFPVMPIHRLNEKPTRKATLLDLTCDSDGKIDEFISIKEDKFYLELHETIPEESYFLGMFLVGAYQETLGDFHNLFGDTDAVHVTITDSGYTIDHVSEGEKIYEILGYMEYDRGSLTGKMRQHVEWSLQKGRITLEEARLLMRHYEESLSRSTYLENSHQERIESTMSAWQRVGALQKEPTRLGKDTPS